MVLAAHTFVQKAALMRRRAFLLSTASAAVGLTLAACSSGESSSTASGSSDAGGASDGGGSGSGITVVASTNVWGDLAATVGGEQVDVTSLISNPDADPHEYEASTRNQLALSKAAIVIENGGGYDDFIDRMLTSAKNTSATVLNAVDISGYTAGAGEELNEHVWYDFPTVKKVVDAIADALGAADAAHKDTFTANAQAVNAKIDELVQTEADLKASDNGKSVAITEPVPLYMLDAIGLVNKTPEEFSEAIEEGDDVPAAVLNDTLTLFTDKSVDLLAYNEQTTGPQTDAVLKAAKDNGVPVVGVTETLPEGKDYVTWMSDNLSAIGDALGK